MLPGGAVSTYRRHRLHDNGRGLHIPSRTRNQICRRLSKFFSRVETAVVVVAPGPATSAAALFRDLARCSSDAVVGGEEIDADKG